MSLAARVTELAKKHELRTLVIDVERLPGSAVATVGDYTVTGPFWSLNDFKNRGFLRRRIAPAEVTEWPRTICAAWRWYGEKKIHFAAEWDTDAATFAETVRDAMDEADVISGHYVNGADRKWLNSLFRDHRLRFPSPYKVIDTLAIARRELGDESNQLGALCERYGIPTKQGSYDAAVARAACDGDKKAQREIRSYNMGDVEASTGLLAVMTPLARGPHVAPNAAADKTLCPRCGSDDVERNGTYSPAVYVYARYLCHSCEGWFRTTYEHRGPSVKAIA